MATFVYVLVTSFLFTDAYRPPIRIFEITKTRHQDSRVDGQYYDPELTRIDKNDKNYFNTLAHYIIHSWNPQNGDNEDYKNSDESVFVDNTRHLPVPVLPDDQTMYRKKPTNYSFLHKLLHSALRSNDAEDRTTAPRHRGNYDNDYY